MKLTNRQLDVLITKVFNEISQPIIDSNNKKVDDFKPSGNVQYFKDLKKYEDLGDEVNKLQSKMKDIANKYYNKEYLGFNFSYDPMSSCKSLTKHLAKEVLGFKKYPTREELETEIILNGADGIKDLIQELKAKYE